MWVFPITSDCLRHPLGVLRFKSILTLFTWRWCPIPQVDGSVSQDCLPPPTLDASHKEQILRLLTTSLWFGYKSEILVTPSSVSSELLEWPTELREILMLTSLVKVMKKDRDEETYKVRSESPVELGVCHSRCGCVCQPRSNSNSLGFYGGFFTEAWPLFAPLSAPLPSLETGEWGWEFEASNHVLVFPVTSPQPGASARAHTELP